MSSAPDLSDLIAKLEKARGPSRDLDARIEHTLAVTPAHWEDDLPAYTSSLDAAVSLVPEGMDWGAGVDRFLGKPHGLVVIDVPPNGSIFMHAKGATPAIALLIAIFKARMQGCDQ